MHASSHPVVRHSLFVATAPLEEAIARMEYLKDHGGGWCDVAGPPGFGKTALLTELARRAGERGEQRAWLDFGPADSRDVCPYLAEAWNIPVSPATPAIDVRRHVQDHLAGLAAMNRSAWLLIDQIERDAADLIRGLRWLMQLARRMGASLTVVTARRSDSEPTALHEDADLHLTLERWEQPDCGQYAAEYLRAIESPVRFREDGIAVVCDRSSGMPKDVAKLVEWATIAAEAESETEIGADLVHAVADELFPRAPRSAGYELSAAYGAW